MRDHTAKNTMLLVTGFVEDHHRLFTLLDEVLASVEHAKLKPAAATFAVFSQRLKRHAAVEDRELFPVFERRTGLAENGPTVMLRREHREIVERLAHIHRLLSEVGDRPEIYSELRALKALLEDHVRREEGVVYVASDRLLTAAERQAVLRALGRGR